MESFINTLNGMNIAELIAFTFVAYFLIKQPLDRRLDEQSKRFDDQNKRFDDLKDMFKSELRNIDKRFDSQDKRFDSQDKKFDDLRDLFKSELQANRDLFKSELESKIKPIEMILNNHITDTHKEIKALNDKLDKIISLKEK